MVRLYSLAFGIGIGIAYISNLSNALLFPPLKKPHTLSSFISTNDFPSVLQYTNLLLFQQSNCNLQTKQIPSRCDSLFAHNYNSYNTPTNNNDEHCQEDDIFIKDIATDTLLNVFFRFDGSGAQKSDGKIMDTEKALKKSLRRLQSLIETGDMSYNKRSRLRKRLSELVLGTSVMRLKYWYYVLQSKGTLERDIMFQNPIQGAEEIACLQSFNKIGLENENFVSSTTHEINFIPEQFIHWAKQIIYEMINCHDVELSSRDENQHPLKSRDERTTDTSIFSSKTLLPESTAVKLSIEQSIPLFLSKLLIEQYGYGDACKLAQISNKPGPITLRRNPIKCSSNEELCLRLLQEESIHASPITWKQAKVDHHEHNEQRRLSSSYTEYALRIHSPRPKSIWNIQSWKEGQFEVQDLGSQLIIQAMELENLMMLSKTDEDETLIVDFCAGNGGKTLAMASSIVAAATITAATVTASSTKDEIMEGKTRIKIIAHDIVADRLKQIEGSLDRVGLGFGNNETITIEMTTDSDSISPYTADAVLVDAPCSSLGVLRRRPSQRWILNEDKVRNTFPKLQLEILQRASRTVKVGGRLIYATCSISRFENEEVAMAFERLPDFDKEWEAWNFEDMNVCRENGKEKGNGKEWGNNWRAILPHLDDCDGFFIARWKRRHPSK